MLPRYLLLKVGAYNNNLLGEIGGKGIRMEEKGDVGEKREGEGG